MNKKITVLGGGSWGTALSKLLSENGHNVTVWLRDEAQAKELTVKRVNEKYLPKVKIPENIVFASDINKAVEERRFYCWLFQPKWLGVLKQIKDEYKDGKIIINASKGIEKGTMKLVSTIIKEETKIQYLRFYQDLPMQKVGLSLPLQ